MLAKFLLAILLLQLIIENVDAQWQLNQVKPTKSPPHHGHHHDHTKSPHHKKQKNHKKSKKGKTQAPLDFQILEVNLATTKRGI
uniref:Uncharacterized protein n=1 Tax=Meloidogyne hapla TaxID=6305 RepID=A0A1I8BSC5_MELHA